MMKLMVVVVVRMQTGILIRIFNKDEGLFESGSPCVFDLMSSIDLPEAAARTFP